MHRARSKKAYHHASDFDEGRIVAYRDCGLSHHSIADRVGRDPMTVSRIKNRWVQDRNTDYHAVFQWLPITSSREDRHVTCMPLMDCAAPSRALRQELGSFASNKRLHEQFVDVCSSLDSQLGNHGCGYLSSCITDRRVFIDVINDELGRTNRGTSLFQINPGSVYSSKMVTSVFGGI
ncbi:HTH_Tnp_Tc3_2 domain-containing protein [Trichonephila clavipes]|nr:HTH_Tnp_Tc3_2 domain-containing protein [Trichonephila clavipes]